MITMVGVTTKVTQGQDVSTDQRIFFEGEGKLRKNVIQYSTLVPAQDVTRYLSTETECRQAAGQFLAAGFERVWLEALRGGHLVDFDVLSRARDIFRAEGLIACGAVTTTTSMQGEGFGERSSNGVLLCYSSPKTQRALAMLSADVCRLFDEVMYDDFMFTDCQCERCRHQKANQSWSEYRCQMRSRVARDFIVRPGHAANPNCIIIIKYPQWYDKFHHFGYDVIRDTANFDAIWIGTETRGADTGEFGYVPVSQSTIIYRWLSSIGREKTRGGWFDYYDCTPDEYVDQAYCTVLNGATELMRFHGFVSLAGGEFAPLVEVFAEHRPHLEKLAQLIRGRSLLGVFAYKPPYSPCGDEEFWFDYFGNMGIALLAVAEFPQLYPGAMLVLTRSARDDKNIDSKIAGWVAKGGSLIVSTGFLAGADSNVYKIFGIEHIESKLVDAEVLFVGQQRVESPRPMSLGGVLEPSAATVRISGQVEGESVPVFTVASTASGAVAAVLNLRTHDTGQELLMPKPVVWIDFPMPAANIVREVALEGTGLYLEVPTRVIVHPFTGEMISLINTHDAATDVRLKLSAPWFSQVPLHLTVYPTGQDVTCSADGFFHLTMPPRARWILVGTKVP